MREEISWLVTVIVKPGQLAAFKQVVALLVAATKEEPGTLAYEYNVSDDESTVHVFERYRNSTAVVAHVEQTFAQFAERFIALATITGVVVYGSPNAEARKILDGFGAVYMTPFDGFTR